MSVSRVDDFPFDGLIDFCSSAIDGEIVSFSDQYFADAVNLINPDPPIRRPGHYVPTGAWFDGWETRRHNREPTDWVIIKLGVTGFAHGCEVDTAFFNGNEAPAISLEGCVLEDGASVDNANWEEIVAKTPCGPSQRHFFTFAESIQKLYTHVRLHQHPDGGIARFRLFGTVQPRFPDDKKELLDMASVKNGAIAIACSDQHFGRKENLLLPGRGKDMGDGWETARSRTPGHHDWVIIRLGAPTIIKKVVIDTAFFRGNFPQLANLQGTDSAFNLDSGWDSLVSISPKADLEHEVDVHSDRVYTHVKLQIFPDGGVKRVRVFGARV